MRIVLRTLTFACLSIFNALPAVFAGSVQSSELLSGDFIFRVGNSHFTPLFSAANQQTGFTHVGVVVLEATEPFVYHADGGNYPYEDAIQKTPLELFIRDSSRYEIKKNLMQKDSKIGFLQEIQRLYDLKIPFDSEFRLDDDGKKLYCSEYLWKAAQSAGVSLGQPISFWGRKIFLVDTIYMSPFCGSTLQSGTVPHSQKIEP